MISELPRFLMNNRRAILTSLLLHSIFYLNILAVAAVTDEVKSTEFRNKGIESLRTGKISDAIKFLQMAVDSDSTNYLALYNLGTAYFANSNFRNAKQVFYDVLKLRNDFHDVRSHLIEVCIRQGNLDEALRNIDETHVTETTNEEAIKAKRNRVQQLKSKMNDANNKFKQRKFHEALQMYTELVKDCDLSETIHKNKAICNFKLNNRDSAVDDVRHLLSIAPENKEMMYIVAKTYFDDGLFTEGMNWIKNCLKDDQDNEKCRPTYSIFRRVQTNETKITKAIENNDWTNCLDICENTLQFLNRNNASKALNAYFLSYKCRCSLHVNHDQESVVSLCSQALDDANRINPEVLITRAEAHINLENWDEASSDYEKLKRYGYTEEANSGLRRLEKSKKGEDYYKILGVDRNANTKQINKAFRRKAALHHPDNEQTQSKKEKAEKKFRQIATAKEVLTDPEKRRRYDNGEDPNENLQGRNPFDGFASFHKGTYQSGNGFTFTFFRTYE